jgi:hypothetical protein
MKPSYSLSFKEMQKCLHNINQFHVQIAMDSISGDVKNAPHLGKGSLQ